MIILHNNLSSIKWIIITALLTALWATPTVAQDKPIPAHPSTSVWILVDTKDRTLDVFRGSKLLFTLDHIAIGSRGAAANRRKGSQKTPLGRYHITRIDKKSKFRTFIGLDYPNRSQVEQGLRDKVITLAEYQRIRAAVLEGREPPQGTPLGGDIGIHGLGATNSTGELIHSTGSWTQGCVAVTNAQIDKLRPYVEVGTLVIIR